MFFVFIAKVVKHTDSKSESNFFLSLKRSHDANIRTKNFVAVRLIFLVKSFGYKRRQAIINYTYNRVIT